MIVASAIIMQQIDATVITTALPQMAVSLNSDPVTLSVAVTAYLLSVAVFIPVSGWAADRFGGRTVFRAAIALFTWLGGRIYHNAVLRMGSRVRLREALRG